jgi:hypothetical protein
MLCSPTVGAHRTLAGAQASYKPNQPPWSWQVFTIASTWQGPHGGKRPRKADSVAYSA